MLHSFVCLWLPYVLKSFNRHHRSVRSAHHLRAARLLAYFQQCFGENSASFPYRESKLFAQTAMSLVRDTPYEVPFTALKIKHLHSEVCADLLTFVSLLFLSVSQRRESSHMRETRRLLNRGGSFLCLLIYSGTTIREPSMCQCNYCGSGGDLWSERG